MRAERLIRRKNFRFILEIIKDFYVGASKRMCQEGGISGAENHTGNHSHPFSGGGLSPFSLPLFSTLLCSAIDFRPCEMIYD